MTELDLHLAAGSTIVHVSPSSGGRVAQINVEGRDLLVGRLDDTGNERDPLHWGSYPMVPFAGRLRNGRFSHEGRSIDLPANMAPHAIHGFGFTLPWRVLDAGLDYCELDCVMPWPLGGTAHQHIQLDAEGLTCTLSVIADHRSMPVTLGWHPWFRKPTRLEVDFTAMYPRDDAYLPTLPTVAPTPPAGCRDDCFVGAVHPPRLTVAGVDVTVLSDCDHWVVYDMPEHASCVEPQSGPPDAANLGLASIIEPGEMLQRSMRLAWTLATRPPASEDNSTAN